MVIFTTSRTVTRWSLRAFGPGKRPKECSKINTAATIYGQTFITLSFVICSIDTLAWTARTEVFGAFELVEGGPSNLSRGGCDWNGDRVHVMAYGPFK